MPSALLLPACVSLPQDTPPAAAVAGGAASERGAKVSHLVHAFEGLDRSLAEFLLKQCGGDLERTSRQGSGPRLQPDSLTWQRLDQGHLKLAAGAHRNAAACVSQVFACRKCHKFCSCPHVLSNVCFGPS